MKWRNSLSVGYKPFDDDLKKLFLEIDKTLQKLMAARSHLASDAESLMNELSSLFAESFSHQEELMQNLKYAGYYQHKYQHDNFLKEIEEMKDVLMADNFSAGSNVSHISTQVSQWIVLHIATMDNEFGSYYLDIYHLPRAVYEKEEEKKANGSSVYTGRGNLSRFLSQAASENVTAESPENAERKGKPSKLEMVMAMRNAAANKEAGEAANPVPSPSAEASLENEAAQGSSTENESALHDIPTGIADMSAPTVYTDSENEEVIGNISFDGGYQGQGGEFKDPFAGDSDLNDILNMVEAGDPFAGFPSEDAEAQEAQEAELSEADNPFAAFAEKKKSEESPSDTYDGDSDIEDILSIMDEIDKEH